MAGEPNDRLVVVRAALQRQTVMIDDAYADSGFDRSGTDDFGCRTGYRSRSLLTVPMTNHDNGLSGVVQLLNKVDPETGVFVPFQDIDRKLVEAVASMVAMAVLDKLLIEAQRELFESFIQLIAAAIDDKSPHTAGHCRRVPARTSLLADAVCATGERPLAGFSMTPGEREIINNHMVTTIRMPESLPQPRRLRRLPEFAGGHHERMDGRGFPRGLTGEQMSLPARMMAIADIVEALTARDRPYKPLMPISQALAIPGRMKLDRHIDPDLFDVLVREQVYLKYAREFLMPEQIDAVDVQNLPLGRVDLAGECA